MVRGADVLPVRARGKDLELKEGAVSDEQESNKELWEEYKKAENGNQRFFVLYHGATVKQAKRMEENLRVAFERALEDGGYGG